MSLRAPVRRIARLPIVLATVAGLTAQTSVSGPYDSESFESPRYALGAMPGQGFADGQDGWLLIDSLTYPANTAAAAVQTQLVRSGQRAVRFDAARLTPGCFGELRRNAMFNLTVGAIEIEFDFLITSATSPTDAWEVYTQPAPNPQSAQMRWWIDTTGRFEFLTGPSRTLVSTNHFVARDVWHHARSLVDITADSCRYYLDGVLVGTGQPIAVFGAVATHGFTQINAWQAGNDAFVLDNLQIRERTAQPGLSVDLEHVPSGQRAVLTFRLDGGAPLAGRAYALLGSFAGTVPGLPLGAVTLPLNPDWFFDLLVANLPALPGFVGTLTPDGYGEAVFDTVIAVPPALLGQRAEFAWVTLNPFDAVSTTAHVRIAP